MTERFRALEPDRQATSEDQLEPESAFQDRLRVIEQRPLGRRLRPTRAARGGSKRIRAILRPAGGCSSVG